MAAGAGRKVSTSIQVSAGSERALRAFLDPALMKQWWGVERALVEERKDGPWALAWGASEHGYHYVVSGIIKSLLPGKRLRIDSLVYFSPDFPVLGPMRLFVNVREKDGRTRVSVRQDGYGQGPGLHQLPIAQQIPPAFHPVRAPLGVQRNCLHVFC